MNKKTIIFLFFITLTFITYGQNHNESKIVLDSLKFSILPFIAKNKNDSTNFQSTKLTSEEIIKIEEILQKSILDFDSSITNKKEKLSYINEKLGYKRQYIAKINSNGEKEVWVNCFCFFDEETDWKTEIIQFKDGGNCYFQLTINLSKRDYKNFYVNGEG